MTSESDWRGCERIGCGKREIDNEECDRNDR